MTVLVTDAGFAPEDWLSGFVPLAALAPVQPQNGRLAIDLAVPVMRGSDWLRLRAALPVAALIRVRLRHVGDTQAYDLARDLRAAGFRGRLRARGAVAPRFYTLLRRAGFSEIELTADQAVHQPSEHWRNERDWTPRRGLGLSSTQPAHPRD
ncbi:MAG: DUF934 domain-containing protein [Rhodobacter sp.]|nr:DUF934 domain-containing protein [Paracoccaceae bacterium]MCC0077214.1 DUF934 domain-containing protein [Rhodobacter sp.]